MITVGFVSIKGIPNCYLNFEGTKHFILSSSERKPSDITSSTEFRIKKNKKVHIDFKDTYNAEFKNENGELILTQEIELAWNKKHKDYVLDHYKLMEEHHKVDHNNDLELLSFKIDSMDIYGFTSKDLNNKILGNYVFFPSNKMAIYFLFSNSKTKPVRSFEEFILERDAVIKSYLEQISKCQNNN